MIFNGGEDFNGAFDFGCEASWQLSKNRGSYWNARDFFWTHREVKSGNVAQVRRHVEAPSAVIDATLNRVKQKVIADVLSPHFQNLVERRSFESVAGKRAQPHHIESNRGLEPFRIGLPAQKIVGRRGPVSKSFMR